MNEEIKIDNNCIVKAFENNPIAILQEDINNKKVYCFKAADIGKALNLSNIRASIQNYEDERVVTTPMVQHKILVFYQVRVFIDYFTILKILINLNAFYFKNLFKDKLIPNDI